MGNVNNYISVVLQKNSVGPTLSGFGTLLGLTQNAPAGFTERTRTYSDDAATAVDYPDATCPERLFSAAVFAQTPAPKRIKLGRRANKSTLVYSLSTVTPILDSHVYKVWVTGVGITRQAVTFTSGVGATDGTVIIGLVAAINAVTSNNYIAAGTTSPATVTADAAGGWFCLQPDNVAELKIAMTHTDPGVTADLTAIALADPDFYQVYNFTNAPAEQVAISTWVEANKRTFQFDTNQSDSILTAQSGGTDQLKVAQTAAWTRTYGFYHHRLDQMPGAALSGRILPLTPGSETSADKNLAGVDPTPLTDTHRTNLVARNANGYESIAGIGVTFQGMVSSGEYYDVTRFLDAFVQDAQFSLFTTKVNNNKVPMSDDGIRLLANDLRGAIRRGIAAGGFLSTFTMVVPLEGDISPADRASRTLNGLKAFCQLAGAIQTVNVGITVIA